MSKTDKTVPYRVWQEQNPNGWNRSYFGMMYLFPRPKREQIYRDKYNGKERAKLRKDIQNLLKMSRKDIEDSDLQSFSHRHSAIWDTW